MCKSSLVNKVQDQFHFGRKFSNKSCVFIVEEPQQMSQQICFRLEESTFACTIENLPKVKPPLYEK